MSTTRRPLANNPATTRTTEPIGLSPRLLPAERIDPVLLPDRDHQRDATGRKGRRTLGRGTTQA
ncbi:hypothetical protein GFH48_38675 [Streptomyces fagopyri]|uniref:Uncharacterized protein n=1 Tax=Streptomyces fagopyri TaxID=2662397 RepID=A0A5Q0LPN6_9ACTN|nr:hypothetical protein [Streptomyces fagopyri]QFZ78416.1 hypothetical protein GFH48_38675 [Streptomyces fagopyri]